MSHQTTIKTKISDVQAFKAACAELGLKVEENSRPRVYGGTLGQTADMVVKLKGPYDVSARKDADGNYQLSTDYWGGDVVKEVGANCQKLTQLYGVHKATALAKKKGYHVTRTVNAAGQPRLTITGGKL